MSKNKSIMDKFKKRKLRQQGLITPENNTSINYDADRNISKKRRLNGKLPVVKAIKMRNSPPTPTPWRDSYPKLINGARILASLKNGSRKHKKKKGAKRKRTKRTKRTKSTKRTKRTKRKRKKSI